jgi:flagellar basal body-associated protein FliL
MKTLYKILILVLITAYISSCAVYTCPTYAKETPKTENKI